MVHQARHLSQIRIQESSQRSTYTSCFSVSTGYLVVGSIEALAIKSINLGWTQVSYSVLCSGNPFSTHESASLAHSHWCYSAEIQCGNLMVCILDLLECQDHCQVNTTLLDSFVHALVPIDSQG